MFDDRPQVKCIDWDKLMLSPGLWGENGMSGLGLTFWFYGRSLDRSINDWLDGMWEALMFCLIFFTKFLWLPRGRTWSLSLIQRGSEAPNLTLIDATLEVICQSDRIVDLDRIAMRCDAMPRSEAVCAYKEWSRMATESRVFPIGIELEEHMCRVANSLVLLASRVNDTFK